MVFFMAIRYDNYDSYTLYSIVVSHFGTGTVCNMDYNIDYNVIFDFNYKIVFFNIVINTILLLTVLCIYDIVYIFIIL